MRRNNKKGKLPRKRQFTPVLHRKRHTQRSFIRSFCVCLDGLPDRIQNPSAAARGGESFSLPSAFPFFFLKLSRMSLTRRKSNMAPPPQGWGCHVGLPDRIRTCGLESRSLALYPAGLRVDYRDCATDKKNGFTPLVDPKGFEPSTSALRTRRSPN